MTKIGVIRQSQRPAINVFDEGAEIMLSLDGLPDFIRVERAFIPQLVSILTAPKATGNNAMKNANKKLVYDLEGVKRK